ESAILPRVGETRSNELVQTNEWDARRPAARRPAYTRPGYASASRRRPGPSASDGLYRRGAGGGQHWPGAGVAARPTLGRYRCTSRLQAGSNARLGGELPDGLPPLERPV